MNNCNKLRGNFLVVMHLIRAPIRVILVRIVYAYLIDRRVSSMIY